MEITPLESCIFANIAELLVYGEKDRAFIRIASLKRNEIYYRRAIDISKDIISLHENPKKPISQYETVAQNFLEWAKKMKEKSYENFN